jgi:hypothetical protein
VPVYLRFDPPENFVPEVHRAQDAAGEKGRFLAGNCLDRAILGDFPQFFPQVWKTLARDQTRMESLRQEWTEEGR